MLVNGKDATRQLRTETAGAAASAIAAYPAVRAALVQLQLGFRQPPGLVADGRDMGTVIFPDAAFKVFLTASAEERARRRYKQLKDKGVSVNLDSLLHEIAARDERDAGRAVAPLKPADDAVILDSTGMPITEVIDRVLAVLPDFPAAPASPPSVFRPPRGAVPHRQKTTPGAQAARISPRAPRAQQVGRGPCRRPYVQPRTNNDRIIR